MPSGLGRSASGSRRASAARLAALLTACRFVAAGPAAAAESVLHVEGGHIRGFDPVKASDVASALAIARVYEGVLQYAYLDRPYRVEPNLAASMPEFSSNGLTCTVTLRRGIVFQDDPCFTATGGTGRELTAEDFVYSIKRVADLKNASTGYWAFRDRIVGLDAFRAASAGEAPTDYDAPVEGLQAPDRYTLRITLTQPYPQLLWILTMQYASAVPREAVEYYGPEFVNHPVGTGPYMLRHWVHDYRVEYVRSPTWRETGRVERYPAAGEAPDAAAGLLRDAGRPLPLTDRLVEHVVGDASTQWLLFLTGQLATSGISRDNWDAVFTAEGELVPALRDRGIRLTRTPAMQTSYLGFNMEDPVVGPNKRLRQAMSCAFDTQAWVRFNNHRVIPAAGPVPPGASGYTPREPRYGFDLERARTLLREAGYPDGRDPATGRRLQLTLEMGAADTTARETAELIAAFMDRIGIVVQASYNNRPTYFAKLEQRRAQMFLLGWVADYPDAENFLQLFYGPNSSPGANHANYVKPECDRLYERLRAMADSPERTALCRAMEDIVVEDMPWLYLHHPISYGLHHEWLRNFKPHDFPYGMSKYHRVDPHTEGQHAD